MVLQIIGFSILAFTLIHGYFSWTVMYIIRPYKSVFLDLEVHPELRKKYLYYFRFSDITGAYLWLLLFVGSLFILISDLNTSAALWKIIFRIVTILWAVVGFIYKAHQVKNDYPDRRDLKEDLKRYLTYKTHWYYSSSLDIT